MLTSKVCLSLILHSMKAGQLGMTERIFFMDIVIDQDELSVG